MEFKFIDLFAGIGGFHTAMKSAGGRCVFASELDKYARLTYEANYKDDEPSLFLKDSNGEYLFFNDDITKVNAEDVPTFDVCCGGFPCQPFSNAGLKKGFEDTRGTLFFNIANLIKAKVEAGTPPKVLFLENVKGLKTHDGGNTLKVILDTIEELGYAYAYDIVNARYFGLPQNRERLFIVAWHKDSISSDGFWFPYGIDINGNTIYDKEKAKTGAISTRLSDILKDTPDTLPISDKAWEGHKRRKENNVKNGKGFGYKKYTGEVEFVGALTAVYYKDGQSCLIDQTEKGLNPRKLSVEEAGRLQGYNIISDGWASDKNTGERPFNVVVSKVQAYKQFGNSVAVPVVKRIAEEIVKQLLNKKK
jgi:DNA (cytosine-5)-methyltransferase 1